MESPFNPKRNNDCFNFDETIKLNEYREELISKRKEFIQNYRKKQRLLSLIESKNEINNNDHNYLTLEDIEMMPDPISRIILLKNFLHSSPNIININFIKSHEKILKTFISDFKKILFDYKNKNNIEKQIYINRYIIYCYLYLLFEPESNPLINEFDIDFLINLNYFCLYYLNNENDFSSTENIDILHLYILLLLNNLIRIYPDVELLKSNIDIKKFIHLIYNKHFFFINNINNSNNNSNNNKIEYENVDMTNLNKCDNFFELFEFVFLKLIENCILFLYLPYKMDLIELLLSLIYYNYSQGLNKLLIYSLETLVNIKTDLLLENKNYNIFLLNAIDSIILSFNNNENKSENQLKIIKLFFELYLQLLYFYLEYNSIIKSNINYSLYLDEKIIKFFKNYYFYFYQNISSGNKQEINISELKIISKLTKIFGIYFNLRNTKNLAFISLEQKNNFQNILCSHFISKDNNGLSLCDILLNIFNYLVNSQEKYSIKICNLIIGIFNDIFPLKNLEYKSDISYIKYFQIFLIKNYSFHKKLFPYLNIEKYSYFAENILDLVNRILFFCEQIDLNEKGEICLFKEIKKELYDLNIFEEIENIECNTINNDLKLLAQQISSNFLIQEN